MIKSWKGTHHENCDARHCVRFADVAEESCLHDRGGLDAGAWDWRECYGFYAGKRRVAQRVALPGFRFDLNDRQQQLLKEAAAASHCLPRLSGLEGAKQGF